MRKLVKILLTILVIIVSVFIGTALNIAIAPRISGIPGLVMLILMVGGIVGVWKYKPKETTEENNETNKLDKTL